MRTLFSFNPCNPENVVDVVYSVQEENFVEPGNTVEETSSKQRKAKNIVCVSPISEIFEQLWICLQIKSLLFIEWGVE